MVDKTNLDLIEKELNDYTLNRNDIQSLLFADSANLYQVIENAIVTASKNLGAGFCVSALGGVGVGVGIVFGKLVEGLSNNPEKEDLLVKRALIGFAVTEALGLFALMMAFLILFL